jgi:hypothetical protein
MHARSSALLSCALTFGREREREREKKYLRSKIDRGSLSGAAGIIMHYIT